MLPFFSCCLKPAEYQVMAQTGTPPTSPNHPYLLITTHLIPSEIHIQHWLTNSTSASLSLSDCPIRLFAPTVGSHIAHGQTVLASYAPDIIATVARSSTPAQRHAIVQNLSRECRVRKVRDQRWRGYVEVFQRLRREDDYSPSEVNSWRNVERLFEDEFEVTRLLEKRLQQVRDSFASSIAEERAAEALEAFDELWRSGQGMPSQR